MTETPGEALLRLYWRDQVEPHLPEGASERPERPDYKILPANVRARWERCARDFDAWLRAQDGGADEGDEGDEPSGS